MLHNRLFESARTGELVLHCTKVVISQDSGKGFKLSGHGTIKINSVGTVYLEFVCIESDGISRGELFHNPLPADPYDSSQKLKLEVETINGDKFISSGFSLNVKNNFHGLPLLIYVLLYDIEHVSDVVESKAADNYLYFEFREKSLVPKNKSNSLISSLGSESHSWNQTVLEFDGVNISIVVHEDYCEVAASGSFDVEKMYESLTFYIGLTSGCMPQCYGIVKRIGAKQHTYIRGVHNSYKRISVPGPMPEHVSIDGKINNESHHEILKNMYAVSISSPLYFDSAYAQWKRVWHGYNSQDNIAMLSLSVSVEGLLNDIFLPRLKEGAYDDAFNKTKIEVAEKVSCLEIDPKHLESIVKFVERWGNIHAPKALSILVDKGLISEEERKAWEKIRNSSAHPTFIEQSDARQIKDHERMARCLNLFYRLVLNVFEYSGAQYEYGEPRKANVVVRPYVNIVGSCSE